MVPLSNTPSKPHSTSPPASHMSSDQSKLSSPSTRSPETSAYFSHNSNSDNLVNLGLTTINDFSGKEKRLDDFRWMSRGETTISSKETQASGIRDPSIEMACKFFMEEMQSEEGEEINSNTQPSVTSLNAQIFKLKLGRRIGRSRKNFKKSNFFDFNYVVKRNKKGTLRSEARSKKVVPRQRNIKPPQHKNSSSFR